MMITQTPEFRQIVTKRTKQVRVRRRSRKTGEVVTDEALARRRDQAMSLRVGGAKFREIAKALDISLERAYSDVQTELLKTARHTQGQAQLLRALELERIDRLWMQHWTTREDPRSAMILLRLSEARRKLLGLDLADDKQAIPILVLSRIIDALTEVILAHVTDGRIRRRIAGDFNRVIARANLAAIDVGGSGPAATGSADSE